MTELEDLIQQKKDIEKKIRELRKKELTCGRVKYEMLNLPRGTEHTISIKTDSAFGDHYKRYYKVIYFSNKEVMLDSLHNLIDELKGMEEQFRKEVDK